MPQLYLPSPIMATSNPNGQLAASGVRPVVVVQPYSTAQTEWQWAAKDN